jgi:hypothetical protein
VSTNVTVNYHCPKCGEFHTLTLPEIPEPGKPVKTFADALREATCPKDAN